MAVFLPYEDTAHELHYDHAAELKRKEEEQQAWDELFESNAPYQLKYTTSADDHETTNYF